MHTKKLLLLILISCVVTKNDADEEPILENSTNYTQTEGEDGEGGENQGNNCACSKKGAGKQQKK